DVRHAVQGNRDRRLTRRASRGEAAREDAVLAANGRQGLVVEREERSSRLERRRPRVADVQDVRPLTGGRCGENAVEQVVPANDLKVDGDAGALLELVQFGLQNRRVVFEARALVAAPV